LCPLGISIMISSFHFTLSSTATKTLTLFPVGLPVNAWTLPCIFQSESTTVIDSFKRLRWQRKSRGFEDVSESENLKLKPSQSLSFNRSLLPTNSIYGCIRRKEQGEYRCQPSKTEFIVVLIPGHPNNRPSISIFCL
jgi:hypothetical protein